jgi:L-threonylcarbamoyladenylate synthase
MAYSTPLIILYRVKMPLDQNIQTAIQLLTQGQLVVIPTETVYGLAANAFNRQAVDRIYELKKRPRSNPLILHISSVAEAGKYVTEILDPVQKLMDSFWPGPLTLLLPKSSLVPDYITAGSTQVALRVPRNHKTLMLLKQLDFPLVAPSANPFTYISPTRPEHLHYCYGDQTPYILDGGPCEEGIESTIAGFEKGQLVIYRLGAVTVETLENYLDCQAIVRCQQTSQVVTPGMHAKHYSPKTQVQLADLETMRNLKASDEVGWITFSEPLSRDNAYFLGAQGLKHAASLLYVTLYELDQKQLTRIVIEKLPEFELGRSLMDRLKRSAV